jgi:hypothetical protein
MGEKGWPPGFLRVSVQLLGVVHPDDGDVTRLSRGGHAKEMLRHDRAARGLASPPHGLVQSPRRGDQEPRILRARTRYGQASASPS